MLVDAFRRPRTPFPSLPPLPPTHTPFQSNYTAIPFRPPPATSQTHMLLQINTQTGTYAVLPRSGAWKSEILESVEVCCGVGVDYTPPSEDEDEEEEFTLNLPDDDINDYLIENVEKLKEDEDVDNNDFIRTKSSDSKASSRVADVQVSLSDQTSQLGSSSIPLSNDAALDIPCNTEIPPNFRDITNHDVLPSRTHYRRKSKKRKRESTPPPSSEDDEDEEDGKTRNIIDIEENARWIAYFQSLEAKQIEDILSTKNGGGCPPSATKSRPLKSKTTLASIWRERKWTKCSDFVGMVKSRNVDFEIEPSHPINQSQSGWQRRFKLETWLKKYWRQQKLADSAKGIVKNCEIDSVGENDVEIPSIK